MSKAKTVKAYLDELPPESRREIARVRQVVRRNLPAGYRETMQWGMITYEIPLSRYADTYNGRPLCYAGLAAQKRHNTLHLMGAYADPKQRKRLEAAFRKSGKKMDMGKSCLHFREAADLPLETIGELIAAMPPEKMIEVAEAARRRGGGKRAVAVALAVAAGFSALAAPAAAQVSVNQLVDCFDDDARHDIEVSAGLAIPL